MRLAIVVKKQHFTALSCATQTCLETCRRVHIQKHTRTNVLCILWCIILDTPVIVWHQMTKGLSRTTFKFPSYAENTRTLEGNQWRNRKLIWCWICDFSGLVAQAFSSWKRWDWCKLMECYTCWVWFCLRQQVTVAWTLLWQIWSSGRTGWLIFGGLNGERGLDSLSY